MYEQVTIINDLLTYILVFINLKYMSNCHNINLQTNIEINNRLSDKKGKIQTLHYQSKHFLITIMPALFNIVQIHLSGTA